ncbi:MAG: hypothetical protein JNN17_21000 [Verrucomicrobiaceae bacterium]|nr:hypothetical protein [Verrucomicrobiaceae bacterium]
MIALICLIYGCDAGERPPESAFHKEVVHILTYEWNPTNESIETLKKYELWPYAPPILAMLEAGETEQAIAGRLLGLERNDMKIQGDQENCVRVAKLLLGCKSRHVNEWKQGQAK